MKDYKCLECGEVSNVENWDRSTSEAFGGNTESIDTENHTGFYYTCPICCEDMDSEMIELVEIPEQEKARVLKEKSLMNYGKM